jgi:hypothetical protein
MNYEIIFSQIKAGGLPATTGLSFTKIEAESILKELEKRKAHIDNYYERCVELRVKKSGITS